MSKISFFFLESCLIEPKRKKKNKQTNTPTIILSLSLKNYIKFRKKCMKKLKN